MSIFKRKKSENSNYSTSSSTPEQWSSDELDSTNVTNYNNDETYDYGIKFKKELSNSSLVFLIVDDDYDHAGGYVVVSPSGIPTVIIDDLYEIDDIEKKHVESLAKTFFEATRK